MPVCIICQQLCNLITTCCHVHELGQEWLASEKLRYSRQVRHTSPKQALKISLTFDSWITDGSTSILYGVRVMFTPEILSLLEDATRWHIESFVLIIPHSCATYTAVFRLSPVIKYITQVNHAPSCLTRHPYH